MKEKHKRLIFLTFIMISFFIGSYLVFFNLRDNLVFFYSPTDILGKKDVTNKTIRIGGLVIPGSVKKEIVRKDGKNVEKIFFEISDNKNNIAITHIGILPDLFKEGQGVVAEGFFDDINFVFDAKKILAKHDENYMPPEVKDSLK
tara:strand:- start:2408 stop:2842 length:435 start_codon:yes stop_codon:yes gene_type:complete